MVIIIHRRCRPPSHLTQSRQGGAYAGHSAETRAFRFSCPRLSRYKRHRRLFIIVLISIILGTRVLQGRAKLAPLPHADWPLELGRRRRPVPAEEERKVAPRAEES